jgi:hypothetical protein
MPHDENLKKTLPYFPEKLEKIRHSRLGKFFYEDNIKKFEFYFEAKRGDRSAFYKFVHGSHEYRLDNLSYQSVYNMYQSVEACRKTVLKRKLSSGVKLDFIFLVEMIKSYLLLCYKYRSSGDDIIYIMLDQIRVDGSGTVQISLDEMTKCAPLKDLTPLFNKHINNLMNIAKVNGSSYLFTYIKPNRRNEYISSIMSHQFLEKSIFIMKSEFSCLF